ncbi:MAG: hypothetical protein KDC90_06430 [Ignavibacteriae bacterium]|nr:hypothetical protein [Ignavibacteriota bacterium]
MIDNIKLRVINKLQFEHELNKTELLDLTVSTNHFTGEIYNYPKKGKLKNLELSITEQNAYLKGSLHKYFNNYVSNENQNYNDFSYCDLQFCIKDLIEKFNVETVTKLTNLEFGLNINTDLNPDIILDQLTLMFDLKSHNRDLKFQNKGNFKEFIKSDYSFKIYNKGKQFKLPENILRVELKITKSRELEKMGVYKLEDLLNPNVLNNLYLKLKEVFSKILIIHSSDSDKICAKDLLKLKDYTNPNYWISLRSEGDYKKFYRIRKDFDRLISLYSLDEVKKGILDKMEIKYYELIEGDCYSLSYDNIA